MKHLCPRIDDLEQYSRDNCLLKFSGISQNSDQKKTTDEILNVVNKVVLSTRLTQQSLEIPILLELWDPRRITQRRHSTSRQVHRSRHMVFPNKRNLKTYNNNDINLHRISINEVLNKTRVQLFTRLCKYKCNGLIHSHWTFEGQLFMKILNAVGKTLV